MMAARRTVLAGAAAAAALPLAAGAAGEHPDAVLIEACAEHLVTLRAIAADTTNLDDGPLWEAYDRAVGIIDHAKPATVEGMLAKAYVAKFEARNSAGIEQVDCTSDATSWAWDLLNDLLRLHGRMPA